jgi:hypothetical protein
LGTIDRHARSSLANRFEATEVQTDMPGPNVLCRQTQECEGLCFWATQLTLCLGSLDGDKRGSNEIIVLIAHILKLDMMPRSR